jgi:threonine dehydratase
MTQTVTLRDIYVARGRIAGRVRRTPLVLSETLSAQAGCPVHLKLEHHQITGSFKLRGATNAVVALSDAQREAGVVGVSTGNHGRGLAYAAKQAGVRAVICMSSLVPRNKVRSIEALGAEVRIVGRSQDEAEDEVAKLVAAGMTMLPPFDHAHVIAGQGTLGLEILEDLPDTATVVVPLSGGGLIAGVARAVKSADPAIRVVGVTMARGAAMFHSQQAGHPVQVEELPTLADALGGGIGLDNRFTFAMVRDLVDDLLLVDEDTIAQAIRHAYKQEKQVIEGSGAVGIAALLTGGIAGAGPIVLVVSGGNVDMEQHARLICGAAGR